jgi:folylpolyglutamate synthase/dihydrofolate synthase
MSALLNKESQGWMFFLLSCTLCATYSYTCTALALKTSIKVIASSTESDYVNSLKQLFAPMHTISRHVAGELSTEDAFQLRKHFFQQLFRKAGLSKVKVIHVAGTKGKGSTVECIAAGLITAGHRVGVFTSPHLHSARERIKLNKTLISQKELVYYSQEAFTLMEGAHWAVFFDYFLATALLFFGQCQPEYILLECGIGGRYDSTNFLDNPVACVITSISIDHQAILGSNVREIAWHKAGILKRGALVATVRSQLPEVLQVLQAEAARVQSSLVIATADRYSVWCPRLRHLL